MAELDFSDVNRVVCLEDVFENLDTVELDPEDMFIIEIN